MTIRILFSADRTLAGKLIEWATFSEFSHCELIREDGLTLGSDWPAGVSYSHLETRERTCVRWAVAEVQGDAQAAWDWGVSQLRKPYDMAGAFGVWLRRRDWQDEHRWFCSEFVAAALLAAGVELARVDRWRVTPRDLWQSPLLTVIDNKQ